MRSPSRRAWLLLLAPIVVFASACGSDGTDPQPYIEALRADLQAEDDDGPPLPQGLAGCVAEAIVESADADRLDDAGITPEQLAEAESFQDLDGLDVEESELRTSLEASLGDCPLGEPIAEVFAAELPFELPADGQQCVADALDEGDELPAGLAATFVSGEDTGIDDAFAAALADCPAATAELIANAIEDSAGVEVGQDARDCLADEMQARGEDGVRGLLSGGEGAQQLSLELGEACLADLGG